MRRVRIGVIGSGSFVEGAILPALSSAAMSQPPDEGAWWRLRPSSHADIAYQAPFRPEVVALCDADAARAQKVASAHRVRGVYADWRAMIAEAELDVLVCAGDVGTTAKVLCDLGTRRFDAVAPWVWVAGPPAPGAAAAREVARLHAQRPVWLARPLRQAAAHRAARRLIERDEIGRISALHLRWSAPLCGSEAASTDTTTPAHLASSFAAFDLLLGFGTSGGETIARPPQRVAAVVCGGAAAVLIKLASGAAATVGFSAADEWNAALPRLEISGEDGRILICEGGREVRLLQPREATRVLSLPGLAATSLPAVVSGVAEDLKEFLACWSASRDHSAGWEMPAAFPDLRGAVSVLQTMEAAAQAAQSGSVVEMEAGSEVIPERAPNGRAARPASVDITSALPTGTLPLQF